MQQQNKDPYTSSGIGSYKTNLWLSQCITIKENISHTTAVEQSVHKGAIKNHLNVGWQLDSDRSINIRITFSVAVCQPFFFPLLTCKFLILLNYNEMKVPNTVMDYFNQFCKYIVNFICFLPSYNSNKTHVNPIPLDTQKSFFWTVIELRLDTVVPGTH